MDSNEEICYLDSSESETENSNDEAQEPTVTTPLVGKVFQDILTSSQQTSNYDKEQSKPKKSKHYDNFVLFESSDRKTVFGRKIRDTEHGHHVTLFTLGENTILDKIAERNELFGLYECKDLRKSDVKVSDK